MRIDALIATTVFHRLLHPHLRHRFHLRPLNVSVHVWLLLVWAAIVPAGWILWHFVYLRRAANLRLALGLLGVAVALQAAGFISFGFSRDADLLFCLLWGSLVSLLAGLAVLPILRFDEGLGPGRPETAPPGEADPAHP